MPIFLMITVFVKFTVDDIMLFRNFKYIIDISYCHSESVEI